MQLLWSRTSSIQSCSWTFKRCAPDFWHAWVCRWCELLNIAHFGQILTFSVFHNPQDTAAHTSHLCSCTFSVCQSQLPATGVPVTRQRADQMKEMFHEYVRNRTLINWKFYIVSFPPNSPIIAHSHVGGLSLIDSRQNRNSWKFFAGYPNKIPLPRNWNTGGTTGVKLVYFPTSQKPLRGVPFLAWKVFCRAV